jgi:hypothetical protein
MAVYAILVNRPMADRAEGDEILFVILSEEAPPVEVMHLEILRSATALAAPPIPLEHLPTEFAIRTGIELHPRASRPELAHEAFRICLRKSAF